MKTLTLIVCIGLVVLLPARAGAVLFDFDNAPLHAPLPIQLTVGGITATLQGTGQSFSVQEAGVLGFTPAGFGGYCIYPNSIYPADLLIGYSVVVTDFSIMFAPEEYGCDTTALMRVTAYLDGAYVGTSTASAPVPGTWPTGVLAYSNPQGFNSVVVHYESPPPFGCDWGPIFMADNMDVVASTASIAESEGVAGPLAASVTPNPTRGAATVDFTLGRTEPVSVAVFDMAGRQVRSLMAGAPCDAGVHSLRWDGRDDHGRPVTVGVYLCRVQGLTRARTAQLLVLSQ